MTTIAWDGRMLAADRQVTFTVESSRIAQEDTKLFKLENNEVFQAVAFFGDADGIYPWLFCLEGNNYEMPKFDVNAILIDHAGTAWHLSQGGIPSPLDGLWTGGSGGLIALGAMAAGADARRAVEIASMYDQSTGKGIDAITIVT